MTKDEASSVLAEWSTRMPSDEFLADEYRSLTMDAFMHPSGVYAIKGDGYDALMWTRAGESFDILRIVPAPWLVGIPEPIGMAFYAAAVISLEEKPARRLRWHVTTREGRELARGFREHMSRHPIGDVVVSFDGTWLELRQP